MLSGSQINQLNKALQNSFDAIKRDINDVKVSINAQAEKQASTVKEVEQVKSTAVTNDKINVLKIKMGDINEGLKKIWDMEKQLNALKGPVLHKKDVAAALDDLNAKVASTSLRLADLNKKVATESQLKSVVSGMNVELNKLAQEIRKVDVNAINIDDLRRLDTKFAKRFDSNEAALAELRKDTKSLAGKEDLKALYENVKKDLSSMQKSNAQYIKEGEVQSLLKNINKEFDGIANDLSSIKKQNKDFVTASQVKNVLDDISDEFDAVESRFGTLKNLPSKKDVETVKKTVDNLHKKVTNNDMYGASVVMSSAPKAATKTINVKPYRKTKFLSGLLIFGAFASLLASIGAYLTYEVAWMNNFAIGAVVAFIIGMLLKAYVVAKGN